MRRGGQISGVVSLVMIFCALVLCVFAVLTYAAANRERQLTNLTAEHTAAYYEADREAVARVAALDESTVPEGSHAAFSVPAGTDQRLDVEVVREGGRLRIRRWQTVFTGDWEIDDTIEVWSGE